MSNGMIHPRQVATKSLSAAKLIDSSGAAIVNPYQNHQRNNLSNYEQVPS